MQITFTGQETTFTPKGKTGYSTMVVSYVDERGANKSWKLISFSNPAVFNTFKNAKVNDVYEITTRKNDRDFTEWASAEIVEESKAATSNSLAERAAGSPVKTPVVSQYETRDERNLRQRLIVRQSCLAQAVAFNKEASESDLLEQAERFTAWVFEAPNLFAQPDDLP